MILDRFRLDGKAAIVTGAGRGIGAASAVALAEAGADVLVSARTKEQLDEVATQIESTGRKAAIVPADLSDLDAVAGLAEAAQNAFGRVDIVVNNVGGTAPRAFMDTSAGYLERAFTFNVTTAHALTKAATPLMLANGGGTVVAISSMLGRRAGRGYLAYGTAKAGLAHWTRLAARDLAPRIRVNGIFVGSIATSALEFVVTNDEFRTAIEKVTPLGRIGDPSEIAATVVFLASDASSYITGKLLEVDGGSDDVQVDLGIPDL